MLRVQNREKLYLLREGETIRCFKEHEKPQDVVLEQVENEEQLEECLNTFALLDNIEQCNSVQKVVDVSEAKLHWDMLDYEFAAEHKKGDIRLPSSIPIGEDDFFPVDDELKKADTINDIKIIGTGAYGAIFNYGFFDKEDNLVTTVALKVSERRQDQISQDAKMTKYIKEKGVNCNILASKYIGSTKNEDYIVSETLNGSLYTLLPEILNCTDKMRLKLILSILDQLVCAEKDGLYYTDMKLANVLFRCAGKGKIVAVLGDLGGFSIKEDEITTSFQPPKRKDVFNLSRHASWSMLIMMAYFWTPKHVLNWIYNYKTHSIKFLLEGLSKKEIKEGHESVETLLLPAITYKPLKVMIKAWEDEKINSNVDLRQAIVDLLDKI